MRAERAIMGCGSIERMVGHVQICIRSHAEHDVRTFARTVVVPRTTEQTSSKDATPRARAAGGVPEVSRKVAADAPRRRRQKYGQKMPMITRRLTMRSRPWAQSKGLDLQKRSMKRPRRASRKAMI